MSDPVHSVEIDRIRLTGLEVTPERAEHIRGLAEAKLQRLLTQDGWPEGSAGGEVSRLDAPAMHVDGLHSDSDLANGLAQSIFQTLRGVE
jgi:hypothetical protein